MLPDHKEVAMKFTLPDDEIEAVHEYAIYTYLDAVNNTGVESYGIPSVYYYGRWDNCVMMALTLLDTQFSELCKSKEKKLTDLDILILIREFVSAFRINFHDQKI